MDPSSKSIVIGVLTASALLIWVFIGGNEWVLNSAMERCTPLQERVFFSQNSEVLQKLASSEPEDSANTQWVAGLGRSLVRAIEYGTPYHYSFHVERSDVVNASAAPGGEVFVTTGLIEAIANFESNESDASLMMAVLAHEIQHVEKRHGLRAFLLEMNLLRSIEFIFFGDMGGVGVATLSALKIGRDQEREADIEGLKLLGRAQVPRERDAMISMLNMLLANTVSVPNSLLSDHPTLIERRAYFAGR